MYIHIQTGVIKSQQPNKVKSPPSKIKSVLLSMSPESNTKERSQVNHPHGMYFSSLDPFSWGFLVED